jgi:hypothetical protein
LAEPRLPRPVLAPARRHSKARAKKREEAERRVRQATDWVGKPFLSAQKALSGV